MIGSTFLTWYLIGALTMGGVTYNSYHQDEHSRLSDGEQVAVSVLMGAAWPIPLGIIVYDKLTWSKWEIKK